MQIVDTSVKHDGANTLVEIGQQTSGLATLNICSIKA
jgi:hypothetical protein